MATRLCCTPGLPFILLGCLVFVPAAAELQPALSWQCTTKAAGTDGEDPRDRIIMLYEYRTPGNCLDDARPADGSEVCRVDYTKDGVTETLWLARNNRDYCQPRAEKLVQELDMAGFFCRSLEVDGCEGAADVAGDTEPAPDTGAVPDAEPVPGVEPMRDIEPAPSIEQPLPTGSIKTPAKQAARPPAPIDRTATREQKLVSFFGGLFDASLAKALAQAAIPDDFDVLDESTLAAGDGKKLKFKKGSHAWKTRRDEGVVVINAEFEHGSSSFSNVFFGFAFAPSFAANRSGGSQYRYLGIVSPPTASEVVFAGEDKIIISSKWFTTSSTCYSSRTTDEYEWSDSIYGSQQVRRISDDSNPDCPGS